MGSKTTILNHGTVASIRGSVVDVKFDRHLPPIYSVLRTGKEGRIIIEVLSQRNASHVRGIALTPTEGLARGMVVEDTGEPLKAPVGRSERKGGSSSKFCPRGRRVMFGGSR